MNLKTILKEAWGKTFVSSEVRKRNLEDFIDNLPDIEVGEDKDFNDAIEVNDEPILKAYKIFDATDKHEGYDKDCYDDCKISCEECEDRYWDRGYKKDNICIYCGSHLEPKEICKCRINTGRDKPKHKHEWRTDLNGATYCKCGQVKSGKDAKKQGIGIATEYKKAMWEKENLEKKIEDKPTEWRWEGHSLHTTNSVCKPKDWRKGLIDVCVREGIAGYVESYLAVFIQELLDDKDREIAKYQRREDEHCRMLAESTDNHELHCLVHENAELKLELRRLNEKIYNEYRSCRR